MTASATTRNQRYTGIDLSDYDLSTGTFRPPSPTGANLRRGGFDPERVQGSATLYTPPEERRAHIGRNPTGPIPEGSASINTLPDRYEDVYGANAWDFPGWVQDELTGQMVFAGKDYPDAMTTVDPVTWGLYQQYVNEFGMGRGGKPPAGGTGRAEGGRQGQPAGPLDFPDWYNTMELPSLQEGQGGRRGEGRGGEEDPMSSALADLMEVMEQGTAATAESMDALTARLDQMEASNNAQGQDPWAIVAALMNQGGGGGQEPWGGGSSYTMGPYYPGGSPY